MLSDRLKIALEASGLTQAELARACKVKPPSVHGWFNNKSKFLRGENLLSAAKALGVSQHWLATGEGAMLPARGVPSIEPAAMAEIDLDGMLQSLSSFLAKAEPEDREALQGLLASLVRKPGDQRILGAIKLMLDAKAFVDPKQLQA